MVNRHYPKGYPTAIMSDYRWKDTPARDNSRWQTSSKLSLSKGRTVTFTLNLDPEHYADTLFIATRNKKGPTAITYAVSPVDFRPELTVNGTVYRSSNRLLSSDEWAIRSGGTNGDSHPTFLSSVTITLSYDGKRLTVMRNNMIDQVVDVPHLPKLTLYLRSA